MLPDPFSRAFRGLDHETNNLHAIYSVNVSARHVRVHAIALALSGYVLEDLELRSGSSLMSRQNFGVISDIDSVCVFVSVSDLYEAINID